MENMTPGDIIALIVLAWDIVKTLMLYWDK